MPDSEQTFQSCAQRGYASKRHIASCYGEEAECVCAAYDKGREAERARIVAWLRRRGAHGMVPLSKAAQDFADLIEAGDE